MKQVPGRKTDVSDAAWLCQLLEAGLLKASFVPPQPIRVLRNLTRYRKTQVRERQREARTPVKYLDHVLEHWRQRPLFYTVNHPGPELLGLAAAGILRELGLALPSPELLPGPESLGAGYADFELPAHPQAAAHYGLAYGAETEIFNVYGRAKTFAQYAAAYVDCRQQGIDDFIGYLQLV